MQLKVVHLPEHLKDMINDDAGQMAVTWSKM